MRYIDWRETCINDINTSTVWNGMTDRILTDETRAGTISGIREGAVCNAPTTNVPNTYTQTETPAGFTMGTTDKTGVNFGYKAPTTNLFDPPSGYKVFNEVGLPELEWRQVWINNSNTSAVLTRITDRI